MRDTGQGTDQVGGQGAPAAPVSGGKNGQAAADLDLGPLHHSFGFQLRRAQLAYKKHFVRIAAGSGFQPSQVGVMSIIGRNPGVTPTALAAALTTDAPQITSIINLLELRGIVSRRTSRSDSRSRSLRLTAFGRREFERLHAMAIEVEQTFVGDALTPEEQEQLLVLLERLRTAAHNRGA